MSKSDPLDSLQTDTGESTLSDPGETTLSELGEVTYSDLGETTDSNSGSGSISDWALVDEDGHLQDYETESTSSSVEVMEEEDEEEDPITPTAGNSPQANVVHPVYILRLSSHVPEVSDTDDEVTASVSDSRSFDVLTSSDLPSSATGEESREITSMDTTSVESRKITSLDTTSVESREITSLDTTPQPQPDVPAEEPPKGTASLPVSPEELESLTRALDDVKSNLLQSQSIDSSLSSFEMFGDGSQDSGKLVPVDTDETGMKSLKGDYSDIDFQLINKVQSLDEDLDQPETIGPLAVLPGSDDEGTVAVIQEPAEASLWQQQMEKVYQMIVEHIRDLRRDRLQWYLGGYVMIISLIVCVWGCLLYCSFAPVFVPRAVEDRAPTPAQDPCSQDRDTAYLELKEMRKDLEAVKAANIDLMRRLVQSEKNAEISNENKGKLQEDMSLLEDSIKNVLQELGNCNKDKQQAEVELERKQRDDVDLDLFEQEDTAEQERVTANQSGRKKNRREVNQSENGSDNQSDEYEPENQSTNDGNRQEKLDRNNNEKNERKEENKKKRRKDSKNRKVTDNEEESNTFDEDSSESGESDNQWIDNIFDLMNKTKSQIQDTWDEVRNISDNLWKKHSPTLERLQKKFVKRFEHISNKFQEKVVKKTRKWFGRRSKSEGKDENEARTSRGQSSRTKRRPHTETGETEEKIKFRSHMDDEEDDGGYWSSENNDVKSLCDSRLVELSRKIKILNVKKYESLTERQRWDLAINVKSILRALVHDPQVKDDAVQSEWVRCQSDWWGGGDKQKVRDGCLDYLSCWQVKWAKGNTKKCRKIKQENGNVLDNRCPVGPFYDEEEDNERGQRAFRDRAYAFRTVATDDDYDDGYVDDDDDNDYDNDGFDDSWYTTRAEDRQYQRDEPDDWYFRKAKDLDQPGTYPARQAGPEEEPTRV